MTAQIQFKLTQLADGETYLVSLIPEKSYAHPYNITSTAQVTVKVPTNSFEVKDLKSLQLDVQWQDNSRSDAPAEAPGMDYISFGLSSLGTVDLLYEAGVEMPLFTFKNALPCTGDVALMNNDEDPFMAPNSRSANVGNSITIFGARGEAYSGNVAEFSAVPCQQAQAPVLVESNTTVLSTATKVFPNPAINEVFVDMNWEKGDTDGAMVVLDATGKEVSRKEVTLVKGFNNVKLEVESLVFGIYNIELQLDGQSLAIDRFVKGNR
ncbi:MAG: T9SS type A sorting domain-containing protein [Bacteroidota bacterium]